MMKFIYYIEQFIMDKIQIICYFKQITVFWKNHTDFYPSKASTCEILKHFIYSKYFKIGILTLINSSKFIEEVTQKYT